MLCENAGVDLTLPFIHVCVRCYVQSLFEQQTAEQSEKIFAASGYVLMDAGVEPGEMPYTLENYSHDHFRSTQF